jgi:zinc protease
MQAIHQINASNTVNRKIAPPVKDAVDFNLVLPPYKSFVLKNGVEVFAIDLGSLDTLMVNWIFDAGNWYEDRNGVATAANALLKSGTSRRNAFSINDHFEFYGAYLSRACHHETADINLHCLGRHAGELLPVVAELVMDSIYPEEELAIYKKNAQQRLQVNLKKCDFVAGRLIDAYIYGADHPYGRYSRMEDYQSLQQEELKEYYRQFYQHGHCRIIVAGKLPADIIEQLDRHFGDLPLTPAPAGDPRSSHPILPDPEKRHHIINDPNGVQGAIRIGRNFPNRHHPDFQKFQVLNNVFGGFFGSRLMMNIREDKGYTYGIYSYLVNNRQESGFIVSTEAGKEVCAATMEEVYKEMRLICTEPIGAEELQMARNHTIGTILGDLDGPFHVASRWKTLLLNGLDGDFFDQGIRIVKTVTPEELRELAKKYLDPAAFYELLVI